MAASTTSKRRCVHLCKLRPLSLFSFHPRWFSLVSFLPLSHPTTMFPSSQMSTGKHGRSRLIVSMFEAHLRAADDGPGGGSSSDLTSRLPPGSPMRPRQAAGDTPSRSMSLSVLPALQPQPHPGSAWAAAPRPSPLGLAPSSAAPLVRQQQQQPSSASLDDVQHSHRRQLPFPLSSSVKNAPPLPAYLEGEDEAALHFDTALVTPRSKSMSSLLPFDWGGGATKEGAGGHLKAVSPALPLALAPPPPRTGGAWDWALLSEERLRARVHEAEGASSSSLSKQHAHAALSSLMLPPSAAPGLGTSGDAGSSGAAPATAAQPVASRSAMMAPRAQAATAAAGPAHLSFGSASISSVSSSRPAAGFRSHEASLPGRPHGGIRMEAAPEDLYATSATASTSGWDASGRSLHLPVTADPDPDADALGPASLSRGGANARLRTVYLLSHFPLQSGLDAGDGTGPRYHAELLDLNATNAVKTILFHCVVRRRVGHMQSGLLPCSGPPGAPTPVGLPRTLFSPRSKLAPEWQPRVS